MIRIRLAEMLARKKWNQVDLHKASGVRYNTINDLYHEMAISIKFESLEAICVALECRVEELIEITIKEKPGI